MSPTTLPRNGDAWLERHVHEWVDAGLISEGQAADIADFEHVVETREPQRLPIAAEVASYLGGVLAIMGGAVAVGRRWENLSVFGRLGIAVGIAVVGFLAGAWMMRIGEAGTKRVASALWVLGTGGVAMAVGVFVDEVDPNAGGWLPLLVGIPVLLIGAVLWRNLERPLQFLTGVAGFGFLLGGVGEIADLSAWRGGVVLAAVGAVFATGAAVDRFVPRLVVLATGALGVYIGAFMFGDYNEHLGPALALVTAASVVAYSVHERIVPVLVLGVIGSLIATQALLATTFTGVVASLMVALLGLVIVMVALGWTWRHPAR